MKKPAQYFVDFTKGNLGSHKHVPPPPLPINPHAFGPMQFGISATHDRPEKDWNGGLNVSVHREHGSAHNASSAVYVLPKTPISLKHGAKFELQLQFDLPRTNEYYIPQQPQTWSLPGNPAVGYVGTPALNPQEPWAVALNVKVGDENEYDPEPRLGATCQFHPTGIRLNVPGKLVKSDVYLTKPLPPYEDFEKPGQAPTIFTLGLEFEVFPPTNIARGSAYLSADGYAGNRIQVAPFDHRAFANDYVGHRIVPAITALGAAVVTGQGEGQMIARFLNFSLNVDAHSGAYHGN